MENKEINAVFSNNFSKNAKILLVCWILIFAIFTTLCFVLGKDSSDLQEKQGERYGDVQ